MAFAKLNSMKFVGLDGLSHFWSKAKTWIINRITTEVTAKIAEIVANAPEDLDTLKEIADWISTHEDSASAMNTAISTNTSDIATLKTSVAGKSDTGHTHTKSEITDFPTSLPANGGTATKAINATNDSNGKNIANTYMPKSGGTFNGSVTFEKPTYFNDEIHSTALFPKGDIDSSFSFFKDKEGNNLPRVFGYNCGDVFNKDMCLRYYTLNCSNKNEALKKLNELKKLFASMYPHDSSDYASCVSIHGSLYVSYNDSTPTFGTSYITNYGYCSSSVGDAYVRKDGSIYVDPYFECSYHILYTSDEEVLDRTYDAYILAEEILVKNLSRVNGFACRLHYVLAEHL